SPTTAPQPLPNRPQMPIGCVNHVPEHPSTISPVHTGAERGMFVMLTISGVHAFYGNIEALRGVDLEVGAGEIVALIGANGAGKSTLLMTVCGRPRAAHGRVGFDGQDITRLETFEIVRRGIAQVPEGRRIFPRMTVLEN